MTEASKKRAKSDSLQKCQPQRPIFGYDLYVSGSNKDLTLTANTFELALHGEMIEDVIWMAIPGPAKPREPDFQEAYILFKNGKLRKWEDCGHYWNILSSHCRVVSNQPFLNRIVQVDCGNTHMAAVNEFGKVFTWGKIGAYLGRDTTVDGSARPGIVSGLAHHKIVQVSCGKTSTFALDDIGIVYSWGQHIHGTTGQGVTSGATSNPIPVEGISNVKQISADGSIAGAVTDDGTAFVWGFNFSSSPFAVEGMGSEICKSISCGGRYANIVSNEGNDYKLLYRRDGMVPIQINDAICNVSLDDTRLAAASSDGKSAYIGEIDQPTSRVEGLPSGSEVVKVIVRHGVTALIVKPPEPTTYLQGLFNNPDSFPDIEFVLNDGTTFVAHKNILFGRCSYFATMLRSKLREAGQKSIEIQQSTDVFLKVMEFIYDIDLNKKAISPILLIELYEVADMYVLEGLKEWSRDALEDSLTKENVGMMLQIVFEKHTELETICLNCIKDIGIEWKKDKTCTAQIKSVEIWSKIFDVCIEK